MQLINERKDLADQLLLYLKSHEESRDLSPVDLYNQFLYDGMIMVTDESSADWLLNHIYDLKKVDADILSEIADLI